MKIITSFFLIFCLFIESFAGKPFEGIIRYEATFVFPENMPETQQMFMKGMMSEMTGTQKTIYYSNGKYKFITENKEREETLFDSHKDQVLKLESIGSEKVYRSKGTNWKQGAEFKSVEHLEGEELILDIKCKKVLFQEANSKLEIHYSTNLFLTADHFEKYNFEHFYHMAKITNAVPLRIISIMPDNTKIIFTATKIEEKKLNDADFLPKEGIEVRDISKM